MMMVVVLVVELCLYVCLSVCRNDGLSTGPMEERVLEHFSASHTPCRNSKNTGELLIA